MKTLFSTALLILLLVFTAGATPLTFNGYPAGLSDGQFFVGNASGTLNGSSITMWCVDSLHGVSSSWDVDVINLANPVGLTGLLGLTVNDYRAMFLLGSQFTNTNPGDASLQHIIWSFGNPSAYPLSAAQQAQKNSALASVGNYDFSRAYVLAPEGWRCNLNEQPFDYGKASPIPEPASYLLLGSGLIGLGLIRWRRKTTTSG